jgi:hypothetical protein
LPVRNNKEPLDAPAFEPLINDTRPPDFVAKEVVPAMITISPPVPLFPVPTVTYTAPPRPLDAAPEPMKSDPELPLDPAPVLKISNPLTPPALIPASAV